MTSTAHRVATRYLRAKEDEEAFEVMVDFCADVFLDEFVSNVESLDVGDFEAALQAGGLTADAVNSLGDKTAGFGEWVRALGGKVLKGVWHMLLTPFIGLKKAITSPAFRAEIKASFKRALSHEIRSTQHMVSVAGRLARGEVVNPQERKAALHQMVDILTKAALVYVVGPHIAHLFAGGVWKALATLLSPIDEVVAVMLDKPVRAAAKKLLGANLGMLPSGFYTHF